MPGGLEAIEHPTGQCEGRKAHDRHRYARFPDKPLNGAPEGRVTLRRRIRCHPQPAAVKGALRRRVDYLRHPPLHPVLRPKPDRLRPSLGQIHSVHEAVDKFLRRRGDEATHHVAQRYAGYGDQLEIVTANRSADMRGKARSIINSSLGAAISYFELTNVTQISVANSSPPVPAFALTLLVYLAVSLVVSGGVNLWNRRMALVAR